MNILFIGYWGANEGLSQATINPHLRVLLEFSSVESVHYISLERRKESSFQIPESEGLFHYPYFSKKTKFRAFTKFSDFLGVFRFSRKILKEKSINLVICRSVLAGIIGYFLKKSANIPFAVESFEPHAEYMRERGIWKRFGFSYLIQHFFEMKQMNEAILLMPVSRKYEERLAQIGCPKEKISTVPCSVNLDMFRFNQHSRTKIRSKLSIPDNATVGVYTGKFGGMYMDEEAWSLFKWSFELIQCFYLMIITPNPDPVINNLLKIRNLPFNKIKVICVEFSEMPQYLSSADFAFSLHYPTPSMKYVSPIKNGEFWACGLPIIMPGGIGDDCNLISEFPVAGTLFDLNESSMKSAIDSIKIKISKRPEIREIAKTYRNLDFVKMAYRRLIYLGNN
jgi:glycosyltransferase involved in cell wall biosynthesis